MVRRSISWQERETHLLWTEPPTSHSGKGEVARKWHEKQTSWMQELSSLCQGHYQTRRGTGEM